MIQLRARDKDQFKMNRSILVPVPTVGVFSIGVLGVYLVWRCCTLLAAESNGRRHDCHDCCIVRLHWSLVTVSVCMVFKLCRPFFTKRNEKNKRRWTQGGCFSQDLQQSAAPSVSLQYIYIQLKSSVKSQRSGYIYRTLEDRREETASPQRTRWRKW